MSKIEMISYKNTISLKDYINLRNIVGFSAKDMTKFELVMKNTFLKVSAFNSANECVGMGRVVGDGFYFFQIVDLIVHPDYQKRGIGAKIMKILDEEIIKTGVKNAFVSLFSSVDKSKFYNKFEFKLRNHNSPGMYKIIK